MNSLLRKITKNMPECFELDDWNGRGKVTITPKSFWRRIPVLKKIIAYHVGDKVRFHIHIEKPILSNGYAADAIWEQFGNHIELLGNINTDYDVEKHRIDTEGDVKYLLGKSLNSQGAEIIFYTKVVSWDTVVLNWSIIIVTAFITFVVTILGTFLAGIALGIIDIPKILKLVVR